MLIRVFATCIDDMIKECILLNLIVMQRLVCSVNVPKYRTVDFQQTLFNYLMFIILIISVNSLGKVLYKQLPICDIFILAHFKRGQDIND